MQRSTVLVSVLLALSVTAYPHSESRGPGIRRYAAVSNELGYRLQRAQSYQSGNQLFSPYGISTVLSAIYEGAEGSSRQQIGHLGYSVLQQQGVDISKSYQQLRSYLQRGFGGSRLEEATVFLYPSDYSVSPNYQEVLESSYRCLVHQVDYSQGGGDIYEEVNRWVQEQTNGKISQIVDEVDASSGLSVLSGIYYQGQLHSQSRQEQQQVHQFQNEGGESSQQSVLYYQTESRYPYYQDQELQAVQIPYQGGEYSLLVVLPSQQSGIRQVQQQVSYSTLQSIISRSQMMQVRVSIPQFSLDYSRDLQQDIQSLGVTSIFGSGAQLSGVRASGSAYVSQIAQRAVLEVGNYGGQQQYHYEVGQESQHGTGQGDQYHSEYHQGQEYEYQGPQLGQYELHESQAGWYGAEEQDSYRFGQQYQYGNVQEGGYGYPSSYQGTEGVPLFQADRPFLFYVIHKPTGLNVLAGRISQL